MRLRTIFLIVVVASAGCTQTEPNPPTAPTGVEPTAPTPSESPSGTTLADGSSLPGGCNERLPRSKQTVAFVAEGRAWALQPGTGRLTCMFEVDDPGPFAWGPQGDRVLLAGLEVHAVGFEALRHRATGRTAEVFDWGHPMGTAIVFSSDARPRPEKLYLEENRITDLRQLPRGTYIDVAYHPSGLALGFILERAGRQSIWISTNEGLEPERLVFSKAGTRFTSIEFTPDGRELVWTAQHANGYPQVHAMDLADRSGFTNGWRGEVGQLATGLRLAPVGDASTVDEGEDCEGRRALVVEGSQAEPLLPDESRPTSALGWLDGVTVLVAAGGCEEPSDLFTVDIADGDATLLVSGVEIAASRAKAPPGPDEVPVPAEEEPPPGGVG
jgi:hypothetical protein